MNKTKSVDKSTSKSGVINKKASIKASSIPSLLAYPSTISSTSNSSIPTKKAIKSNKAQNKSVVTTSKKPKKLTKTYQKTKSVTKRVAKGTRVVSVKVASTTKKGYKKAHKHVAQKPHEKLMAKFPRYNKWHSWSYKKLNSSHIHGTILASWTLLVIMAAGSFIQNVSALSTWSQTDWSGGQSSAVVTGSTATTFESASNINISVNGQFSLSGASNWSSSLGNWTRRSKITIDHTKIGSGNLSDFPVYINLANLPVSFFTDVKSDGGDIRATDSSGNQIPVELVSIDTVAKTGELYFKASTLSNTVDTDFYIYYGNASATKPADTDATGRNAVWSNGYVAVYHMNQGNVIDSTGKGHNGTNNGTSAGVGQIGEARAFNGINNYISMPDSNDLTFSNGTSDTSITITAWVNNSDISNSFPILSKYDSHNPFRGEWTSGVGKNGTLIFQALDSSTTNRVYRSTANNAVNPNQWKYYSSVYNGNMNDNGIQLFLDATLVSSTGLNQYASYTGMKNRPSPMTIGATLFTGNLDYKAYAKGLVDEVQLSSVARSADWLSASYNNQKDTSSFYTVNSTAENKFAPTGTLTSNVFDSSFPANWGTLTYAISGAGTVNVKIRSSNSSAMTGAPAWSTCSAITFGASASTGNCTTDTDRYVQYQVTLASLGVNTPVFESISINYSPSDVVAPTTNASNVVMATAPSGRNISSGGWNNSDKPYFSWAAGADNAGGSGIKGYCLYLGADNTADLSMTKGLLGNSPLDTNNTCQFAVSSNNIDLSSNGMLGTAMSSSNTDYHLLVKAIDHGNNVFSGSPAQFSFKFDNTLPQPPVFVSAPSNFVSSKDVTLTWNTAGSSSPSDADSGIAGLQYRIGNNGTWYGDSHSGSQDINDLLANDGNYQTTDPPDYSNLIDGNNIVYFRVWDNAQNVSSVYTTAVIKLNTASPSSPRNLNPSPSVNILNSFGFSWVEPATFVGSANNLTYCYTVNTLPSAGNCSYTSPGQTTLPADSFATQPGDNTFYVVAKDEAGNINYATYAQTTFTANTSAPSSPINLSIADISVKATSSWKLALSWDEPTNTGAGVNKYQVYRSTSANGTFSKVAETSGKSYVDSGLSQVRQYYKIKACDSANNCSAYSTTVNEFPTGRFTSPADLIGEPKVEVSTRTATITWATNRESDSRVQYGKSSSNYFSTEAATSDQTKTHQIDLTNLEPGTTYFFKARWIDTDGNVGVSSELSFTTLPSPTIKNLEIKRVSLSSATIQFTVRSATSIKLMFGKSEAFGGLQTINTSLTESTYTTELSGLDDGSLYYFALFPIDVDGNEYKASRIDNFTTPARPRIENLRFQPVEGEPTSTQKISWTTNVPASSLVRFTSANKPAKEISDSKLTTDHEVTIKDLEDDTTYNLIAESRDEGGNLAVSDNQTLKTALDTRPPKISDMTIETAIRGTGAEARGQIVVSWKTDEPATSQVAYGEGSQLKTFNNKTAEDATLALEHIVIVSDLPTSRVYSVQPVSKDRSQNTGNGEIKSAIIAKASDSVLTIVLGTLKKIFGM